MLKNRGFTLIELLIVVSVIGVLAGITIAILNPTSQQEIARDGVRQANMNKLVSGVEAYYAAEGSYPLNDSDPVLLEAYIQQWPDDANYIYSQIDADTAALYVDNFGGNGCYKYYSDWGEIRDCAVCDNTTNCDVADKPGSCIDCDCHSECVLKGSASGMCVAGVCVCSEDLPGPGYCDED